MLLADSYFPVYALWGPAAAVASLAAAVLIELPLLRLIWRTPIVRLLIPVLLANLISALCGIMPIIRHDTLVGIGVDSDPLETVRLYWHNQIWLAWRLFTITLMVELCIYLAFKYLARWPASVARVCVGTMAANIGSYALLVGYMFAHLLPAVSPQFALLPDTSWVRAGSQRVWFVDSDSNLLSSIRLDGTDRQEEALHQMPRCRELRYDNSGTYVIAPGCKAVLYTDRDFKWWARKDGHEDRLPLEPPRDFYWYALTPDDLWLNVQQALSAAQCPVSSQPTPESDPPVFFFTRGKPDTMTASDSDLSVTTHYLPDGTGYGDPLRVEGSSTGTALSFGVSNGLLTLGCVEPAILKHEKLVLFRCGGWIMVMDLDARKVGRLVHGTCMVLQTRAFGPPAATRAGS